MQSEREREREREGEGVQTTQKTTPRSYEDDEEEAADEARRAGDACRMLNVIFIAL